MKLPKNEFDAAVRWWLAIREALVNGLPVNTSISDLAKMYSGNRVTEQELKAVMNLFNWDEIMKYVEYKNE